MATFIHSLGTLTWLSSIGYSSSDTIGWNNVLYVIPLAGNTMPGGATAIGTHSSTYYEFNQLSDVSSNGSGLSALALAAMKAHFNKNKGHAILIAVDKVGTDTVAGIVQTYCETVSENFFLACVLTRVEADITATATYFAGLDIKHVVFALSDEASLYGDDTAFNAGTFGSTFTNKSHCGLIVDSSSSSYNDVLAITKFLSYDPDIFPQSMSFRLEGSVTTPSLTMAQYANALSHDVNMIGTLGPASAFLRYGKLLNGAEIRHSLTRFLVHRKAERLINEYYVNRAEFGNPVNANEKDQKDIAAKIKGMLSFYVGIGRIVSFTTELVPITPGSNQMSIAFEIEYPDGLDTLNLIFKEV